MAEALKRPGGELASRPLHFFWVVDCSGSMYGEKIGTVNHAIQSTIPEMVDAAKDNPNAQLLVRTLKFSTGATLQTGVFCRFLGFCVGCRSPPVSIPCNATMK